jgi:hypothetical protein
MGRQLPSDTLPKLATTTGGFRASGSQRQQLLSKRPILATPGPDLLHNFWENYLRLPFTDSTPDLARASVRGGASSSILP